MADDLFAHTPYTFLVIDHLPLRQACVASLLRTHWTEGVLTAQCGEPLAHDVGPGVALVVIGGHTNDMTHVEAAAEWLHSEAPTLRLAILSFSGATKDTVRTVFQIGACAFLTGDTDPKLIVRALDLVAAGGSFCSPAALDALDQSGPSSNLCGDRITLRQQEVMNYLREGLSNKLIARRMDISEATVKIHVRHIMRRMGAKNRTQIALMASSTEPAALARNG